MATTIAITTSRDDGSISDLKLASLLKKYGIPAIFFIPAKNSERDVISPAHIRVLRHYGAIGSHTYSHQYLSQVDIKTVEKEITNGRDYLEDVLSEKVEHFCYPGGHHNKIIEKCASKLVTSARTTRIYSLKNECNLNINTSLQIVYRRKLNLWKEAMASAPMGIKKHLIQKTALSYQLQDILLSFLNYVTAQKSGSYVIHLWGHSWEIEENNLWGELENIFKILQEYKEYFLPYSECFKRS